MNGNFATLCDTITGNNSFHSSWQYSIGQRSLAVIIVAILLQPAATAQADRTQVATSALEFGGSIGKLLWVSVEDHSNVSESQADLYRQLGSQLKEQIELGRASSSLLKANFDVVGTSLLYSAAVAPEPLSKAVAGVAAWGAKKTGDALGQLVIDQSQQQARAILAQGLRNGGFSEAQLKRMSAEQLRAKVSDLKIGGQTIREILKNDRDSLSMLEANATDIATSIGVEALARSEGTAADVTTIQHDLAKTRKDVADYQKEVKKHLTKIESRVSGLEDSSRIAREKLDILKKDVAGNSKAIRALAQVSYSGWTTAQKLQAVQSDLFPDLTPTQKNDLLASLRADNAREQAVAGIQQAARDFGDLATIASHLGLQKDLVMGLQTAQTIATGISQFATGNVLGAASSLTSLVGLGAPDAAAERHAAMMKYLEQQFAVVNQKLDEIIALQVQTLKAVTALAKEQRQFRREVLGQLDRIESTVLRNEQVLQAILLSQWTQCHALINSNPLNGQFAIRTKRVLEGVIQSPATTANAAGCYTTMTSFLDAWVKPAQWSGQIISASHFPTQAIVADPALQKGWDAFVYQQSAAYNTARDFVLEDLQGAKTSPAIYLARFSQPVADSYFANKLDSALAKQEIQQRLTSFKCGQNNVLSAALGDLLCFGIAEDEVSAPLGGRWEDLLGAALIGPQSNGLIDTGITLSTISDFAARNEAGSFVFVNPKAIEDFSQVGATSQLRSALEQHKGIALLEKLRWLTESSVLQQAIAYGDYTAQLIEKTLYDPATKSLNANPNVVMTPEKQKALSALRANPILARNVVLLAMRHAIADGPGGLSKAEALQYNQTYYALALRDFVGPQACDGSSLSRQKLEQLFPNWHFEYWATTAQKKDEKLNLSKCLTEFEPDPTNAASQLPARGSGVGISIADFYVLAPSPVALSSGLFEQSDSLRLALAYRDRLSQAIIDRGMAATVRKISSDGNDSTVVASAIAFALLNEGWGWQTRKNSNHPMVQATGKFLDNKHLP